MTEKKNEEIAQLAEATLTDEWITEWEDRIGLELRVSNVFNSNASYEAIRNFSNGIGDSNPLYRDEEYAKGTKYEALIAHPSWVASVFPHWVLQGLPGVHADHSASDWEFLRPIYVNDKITPKCYFVGFDTKSSKTNWYLGDTICLSDMRGRQQRKRQQKGQASMIISRCLTPGPLRNRPGSTKIVWQKKYEVLIHDTGRM